MELNLIWAFIGLISGIILGLTGSGGGLVSIPLFMELLNMDLKTATVFSLVAIILGAFINWLNQIKKTYYFKAIMLAGFSLIGSYFSSQYKSVLPTSVIAILLTILCTYGLYNFWNTKHDETISEIKINNKFLYYLIIIAVGISLGIISTLTGIGGGILLVPILTSLFKVTLSYAIATSLLTIGISSIGSLWFQREQIKNIHSLELILLIIGIIISVYFIKFISKKISSKTMLLIRKISFTLVVVLALKSAFSHLH